MIRGLQRLIGEPRALPRAWSPGIPGRARGAFLPAGIPGRALALRVAGRSFPPAAALAEALAAAFAGARGGVPVRLAASRVAVDLPMDEAGACWRLRAEARMPGLGAIAL